MYCLYLQGEGGQKETRGDERIQKGEENIFRYKSYYTVCTIVCTTNGNSNIDSIFYQNYRLKKVFEKRSLTKLLLSIFFIMCPLVSGREKAASPQNRGPQKKGGESVETNGAWWA